MDLSCSLGTTCRALQEKYPRKQYNKYFIDQGCSVKITEYWPTFACVSVYKQALTELGQYPAILTSHCARSDWSKPMFYQSIKHRKGVLFCFHRANEEVEASCYTMIKHFGHSRTLGRCRKHPLGCGLCLYISVVFSNARRD